MPTYSYRCTACHHAFDQFQRMTEASLSDCPVCQGPVKRVILPVGVVFKGSGWYINDSRKSSASENGAGETSDTTKSDAPKKDEAKPAESTAASKTAAAAKG